MSDGLLARRAAPDLVTAWASAHELETVPVDHALAIVLLLASDPGDVDRMEAAAVRWIARFASAHPHPPRTYSPVPGR